LRHSLRFSHYNGWAVLKCDVWSATLFGEIGCRLPCGF